MKYYWTTLYNSGSFNFWEVRDEKELFKKTAKLYCGKPFDYGETTKTSYLRWNKNANN